MDIPSSIGAKMATTQQNVALSVIKQSAQADKQIANMLEQAISPASRGGNVNISA